MCSAQENWEILNPKVNTSARFLDVHLLNENRGFAIVTHLLFETNDKGDSWNQKSEFLGAKQIEFLGNTGFIVGVDGLVIKTTDGGVTWSTLDTGIANDLNSISFIDGNTLVLGGENSIQITTDGGSTWQSMDTTLPGYQETMLTSYFQSIMIGHSVGSSGRIYKTTDGGTSWTTTQPVGAFRPTVGVIQFISETLGYASGKSMELYRTTDAGDTWTEVNTGIAYDSYYAIYFIDENNGYIAGEYGLIQKTTDAGVTWEIKGFQSGLVSDTDVYGLYFNDVNTGFAVGKGGRIERTLDGASSWEQYGPFFGDVRQLEFVNNDLCYALVGNTFFKSLDQGVSWENLGPPITDIKTTKFNFINENIGYSIGGGEVGTSGDTDDVFKTIDGGISWVQKSPAFTDDLYCIDFVNENLGFVSGGFNSKGVFRTQNGGDTWEEVLDASFGEVQFLNSQVGYGRTVGNAFNKIYKTSDSGTTWQLVYEVEEDINSIYFLDESIGYLVGDDALMMKTSDGGTSWSEISVPYDYYEKVKFYNEGLGYIVDDSDHLYKTRNGGLSWEHVRLFRNKLSSIEFTADNSIYVSAGGGTIEKSSLDIETLKSDGFTISVQNESCQGSNNGNIEIIADLSSNYIATFGGVNYVFNKQLTLENLSPGTYDLCLSLQYWEGQRRFQFVVEEAFAFDLASKTSFDVTGKIMQVAISNGTPPFTVSINKSLISKFDETNFQVNVNDGDLVEIASAKSCEGIFSETIKGINEAIAYPIPTNSMVTVHVSTSLEKVRVDLVNMHGILVKSEKVLVAGNNIEINLDSLASGIYIATLHIESPKTIKLIKK